MAIKKGEESLKGLVMLKLFVRKLQRGFLLSSIKLDEEVNVATMVPKDVKQGHFAVIAGKGGEAKRFILELDYLSDPVFIKLLEQAEEEYGFQQKGVLAVPCQPQELQAILGDRKKRRMSTEW